METLARRGGQLNIHYLQKVATQGAEKPCEKSGATRESRIGGGGQSDGKLRNYYRMVSHWGRIRKENSGQGWFSGPEKGKEKLVRRGRNFRTITTSN